MNDRVVSVGSKLRIRSGQTLPHPSAVIFDLDGTLVDTVRTRIEAWHRALKEGAIPVVEAYLATLIGSDGKFLARNVAEAAGLNLTDDQAEVIDRRSGEIYEVLNLDPRPLPFAKDLLASLDARNIRWAIATSSRREQASASVNALALARPPQIIDASHVAQAKPAPDLLLHAARALNTPPSRCWYLGDSTWDMRAAVSARMVAIGVTSGSAVGIRELTIAGATIVCDTLWDVISILSESTTREP